MPISAEDKALIKNLYQFKGYGARKLITEFPEKNWNRGGLNTLISKLRATGSTDRIRGSGRAKTARTDDKSLFGKEMRQFYVVEVWSACA